MTDEELRTLVRDAIRRHLGGNVPETSAPVAVPLWRAHPSFGKFLVPGGDEEGGPCIIEPSVSCNHCGFCQSYGH
jgi:hypothetical protein